MSDETNSDNQLLAALASRRELLSKLRQELIPPLNAVIGYTEILREDAQPNEHADFIPRFKQINVLGKRLLNTINNHIGSSKTGTTRLDFDVDSLCANLSGEMRPTIEELISSCVSLVHRSRDSGQLHFVADLQKVCGAGEKLRSIIEELPGFLSGVVGLTEERREAADLLLANIQNAAEIIPTRTIRTTRPIRPLGPPWPFQRVEQSAPALERGSLLIVDDDENNLELLRRQLERDGHTVTSAKSGLEALDLLQRESFDVALLDLVMSAMNGYEVLERMKADPRMREIPVIMLSTLDAIDSVVKGIEMGAEDYLSKPFNPVLLRARISTCLEKKWLRDQEREHAEQLRLDRERQAELLKDLAGANWELAQTMEQLKSTQAQLLMQEKLASLGAVTAGIAHEIKNPLNFINNFAALSVDLSAELREEIGRQKEKLSAESSSYITDILGDLSQNSAKIQEHGKRADGIIKSMLLHSHGKTGELQAVDLNAQLAEYLNLAYHGMRAQDASFNLTIETDYDQSIKPIIVVPQDLGRVFLNLFNNACYALNEKRKTAGAGFEPKLTVRTRGVDERVEIRIRDNGSGIPPHVVDQIFNPFFTTKPPGQGTGLGLSISFEIIVQQHQGEMRVETDEGEFTEFTITLPRR